VTHNIPSARRLGDHMIVLHEGRIAARGTPDELAASSDELVQAFMHSNHAG
jgi:phospholipid/cholesterol/gamma-HCH transport system ATP-binding protein